MGDRALIQLHNASEVSPVLYLHWGGSEVGDIIERTQLRMKGRKDDVSYAFARLVQEAADGDNGNTGIGVWTAAEKLTSKESHGDAGVFVIDVSQETWVVSCSGGYGIESDSDLTFTITEEKD